MPLEDFETYTEVEPDNVIQVVSATHVDCLVGRDDEAYLYDDKGVGHFGDFEHFLDFKLNSASDLNCLPYIWALTNILDDMKGIYDGSGDFLALRLQESAGPQAYIYLQEVDGGSSSYDDAFLTIDTWYYLRIKRSGTTLTCRIYSSAALRNAGGSPDVDTLTITTVLTTTFRYVHAVNIWKDGNAAEADADIENLDLEAYVLHTKTVTEILGLVDSKTCIHGHSKTVTELLGLVDRSRGNECPKCKPSVIVIF